MNASEAKRIADEYCLNQESSKRISIKESVNFTFEKIKELAKVGRYEFSINLTFLSSNPKVVLSSINEDEVLKGTAEALESEYGYHVYEDSGPILAYVVKWK